MNSEKLNLTLEELIAPCGINCRLCYAYIREKNHCPGCRGDDTNKAKTCITCRMKNCEKLAASGSAYCIACGEFPCALVKHLDKRYQLKYATTPIGNLRMIKEEGMEAFLRVEEARWTCPECGAMLCMHKSACLSCGYDWHK